MVRYLTWLLLILAISSVSTGTVAGQEFHVYTRVYDLAPDRPPGRAAETGSPSIVSRSVSLFHAGKVYDYIPAIGEVIIFQPARPHRRFTILNTSRNVATTITFDELNAMLNIARRQTEAGIKQLRSSDDPSLAAALQSLTLQLNPQFEESFEAGSRRLTLTNAAQRYTAECEIPEAPEIAEAYLRYADWMCRLNYVLHPGTLLPEPRLALNETLRRRGMIPLSVELQADVPGRLHLKAQHKITWTLEAKDRSLINAWESQLKSRTVEHVTIHEYQRTMLISQTADRK